MNDLNRNLWPFSMRAAIVSIPLIFLGLILVVVITQRVVNWPTEATERSMYMGVLVLVLVPLLLALVDTIKA